MAGACVGAAYTNIATTPRHGSFCEGRRNSNAPFLADMFYVCRPKKHIMQCGVLRSARSMHSCPAGCKRPAANGPTGATVVGQCTSRHPHASRHTESVINGLVNAHEQSVLTAAWLAGKCRIVDCGMPNTKRATAGCVLLRAKEGRPPNWGGHVQSKGTHESTIPAVGHEHWLAGRQRGGRLVRKARACECGLPNSDSGCSYSVFETVF